MITQLSTLKTRLAILPATTDDDVILTNTLLALTGRFDRETNRSLAYSATATDEFEGDRNELVCSRYPIVAVSAFHVKEYESSGWVEQEDVEHQIRRGCIVWLPAPLASEFARLRVTYSGGYVMPGDTVGDGQTALPDEIEQAAIEQAVHWYQNRHRLGQTSTSGEGGSISQFSGLDLLPNVAAVLKKYQRYNL